MVEGRPTRQRDTTPSHNFGPFYLVVTNLTFNVKKQHIRSKEYLPSIVTLTLDYSRSSD